LGGGIVGTHAGDMIGEIALAIEMGADAVDIGKTIHPHPTLGESIGMAAEVAHGSLHGFAACQKVTASRCKQRSRQPEWVGGFFAFCQLSAYYFLHDQ
jgi:hypothetical protein